MSFLNGPALDTFILLLLAHVLADFLFQTNWMVINKRSFGVLFIHCSVVFALSVAALGGAWPAALAVAGAHMLIDAIKTWGLPLPFRRSLSAFLLDQFAHVASLLLAALYWPLSAEAGLLAPVLPDLLPLAVLVSGLVLCIRAGGFAVGILMAPYAQTVPQDGLPAAGQIIGQLERTLIFLLVLTNQAAAIGFLIAAKSILRFDTAAQGQKAGEYVIIGTLASFAWALAVAFGTHALLEILPSLP